MLINNSTIIKDHNNKEILKKRSVAVKLPLSAKDKQLLEQMYDYVDKSTDEEIAKKENLRPAVGISAVQLGILKRMFVVILKDEKGEIIHQYSLVNPKIIESSIKKCYLSSGEGCLSVERDHQGYVYRDYKIKIKAYNYLTDKEEIIDAKGFLAIVMQHEYDHLEGKLFYERIDHDKPFFADPKAIKI